jgi:copper chaperone|tara:strand:+ start:1165 stop:1386 length:222 start_codon:yes stop_codon:yes gene_type:complete
LRQETIKVEGMTCQHCVETITDALNNITGLNTVNVDLVKKEVSVKFNENETELKKISDKIIEVGFELPNNTEE